MILTVTLNPALDITHTIGTLVPGETHRARSVHAQAGGKGVNVARVLHGLGHPVLAAGLTAGPTGHALRADLAAAGVPEAFHTGDEPGAETRRTVTLVEQPGGRATVVTEPGPAAVDWVALRRRLVELMADADVVVCSGSLPPGVPGDAYRQLTEDAHRAGARAVVDADGEALTLALPAGPDLVKPNTAELRAATGSSDPLEGGRRLRRRGARRVVVSAGPGGLTGLGPDGAWRAVPAPLTPVNPTGAGDAAVAALAAGLDEGLDWGQSLRRAVAWSAAAVLEPHAGTVSADRIGALSRTTRVTGPTAEATSRSTPPC